MKLSVALAVYNEHPTVADIIRQVLAAPVDLPMEIIAVDDYSTDGTRAVLTTLASQEERLRLVLQDRHQGKGAAIWKGFECVTGDVVIIQDADLEYDPADYPALLRPILEGRADVVFGNRFHGGASARRGFRLRRLNRGGRACAPCARPIVFHLTASNAVRTRPDRWLGMHHPS